MTRQPPPPRRGPRGPQGRRVLVEGVDLGDGQKVTAWLELVPDVDGKLGRVRPGSVTVRRYHSRRRWTLSLPEAARVLAIAAQRRLIASRALGWRR